MPADPCPTCAGAGSVIGDPPASPADVDTTGLVLHNTFGRTEREAAAWLIVRLLQVRGQGWDASFVMRDLADLLGTDEPTQRRCSNPFFRPDFGWLVDNWLVRQTNPETVQEPCFVTENFIERLRRRVDCPTCRESLTPTEAP